MKYEIKGMPNERVIKKYTISDDKKSIMVKYLDGTTDYFPYNKEIESRIVNIMLEQAERYLKKEENVTFKPKAKLPYKQRIIVKIKIILYLSVEAK